MAVAFDASSESHTGTTGSASEASFQWDHIPVGTPRGVTVFVYNLSATGDTATGVTYGGVTVPAVTGGRAVDAAAGEPGSCKAFHLGAGIPTGQQTIVVTRTNNTNVMYATAVTVTAANDTAAGTPTLTQEDGTVAEVSVSDLSNIASMRIAGGFFGHQIPPTAGASSTVQQSIDTGAQCALVATENTPGTGSRPVGFSHGTSDDRAIVTFAIREVLGPALAALSFAGTVTVLAVSALVGVGALTFTGHAPTVSMASAGTTIEIPAGSLVFKGPSNAQPSAITAAPDAGVLSFEGHAPTLFQGPVISIGTGSLVFKGPARSGALTLAPDAGTLAFTGHVPGIETSLGIPVGSLAFDGQFVGIAFAGPEPGALTLTGHVPVVIEAGGTETIISIDAGALVLIGQAPAVVVNHIAAPDAAALSLTGQTLTLEQGLPVGVGSLAFTGAAPSLDTTVGIAAGTLTLSGHAPAMLGAGALSPDTAAITFTGHVPSLSLTIPVAGGTLTLAGQAPQLSQGLSLSPDAAVLSFSGHSPTLVGAGALSPSTGTLVLSGHAPQVRIAFAIGIDAGTLTLTGQAPSLSQGVRLTPDAGVLVLSGQAPTLGLAHRADPAVGVLTLTGYAPSIALDQYVATPDTGTLTFIGHAPSLSMLAAPDLVELTATFARTVTVSGTFARVINLTVER